MNALKIPTKFDQFRSLVYRILRWPYLVTGGVAYLVIALLVVVYLQMPAKYKSEMELVLPGTGASSNVSLNEVGQVVSQTTAPFSGGGFNPRVNYKQMLMSRTVLEEASEALNMSMKDFGQPKVTLTEQTSIITVSIASLTPEHAEEKAWALYTALQAELDELRADEVERRDNSIKAVLQTYRERTNFARNSIVDFQQRSLLVSQDQIELMIKMQADLKHQKHMLQGELTNLEHYVNQLSEELQVSPHLASIGLMLQSDPNFTGYVSELNVSIETLTEFTASWGASHPKVIAQKRRAEAAREKMLQYVGQFVGVESPQLVSALTVNESPKRAQLFSQLIDAMAKLTGTRSELIEIERAHVHVSDELKVASREVAELDRLQREFDLAEAVFTSAAARLEANKADVFASYPVLQMLSEPSLEFNQTSPKVAIAIAAGLFGFVFITIGLIVLWQRDKIINLILKKS
ncbi:hypothetical protein QTP81_01685 [Alteromonas sp. ASW11-36]|uniref:Polysaccharide chain length determinant N-terminal domain-containing protein n=1 Tax=Alteromonas arenosi TaxID=3055817 RepID=A0ABT7SSZ0_9ALTE|nr:hypothetical protein [Alteromonas sp. ASW11-36]MDM7859315.1 hypothetical protein [Alteromonas sp. ASW11-36]